MSESDDGARKARWRAWCSGAAALVGVIFAFRGEPVFGLGLLSGGAGVALLSLAEMKSAERASPGSGPRLPRTLGGLLTLVGVVLLLVDFLIAP